MGGMNTKLENLNNQGSPDKLSSQNDSKALKFKYADWPNRKSRIEQVGTMEGGKNQAGVGNNYSFGRIDSSNEEGKIQKNVNKMNNAKFHNTLNKRQNVLPNMTMRVMKNNLVLCKSPIGGASYSRSFHNNIPQTVQSDTHSVQDQIELTPQDHIKKKVFSEIGDDQSIQNKSQNEEFEEKLKIVKEQSPYEKENPANLSSEGRIVKSNFEFSRSINGDYPPEKRTLEKGLSEAYRDFDPKYYQQLKKNLELQGSAPHRNSNYSGNDSMSKNLNKQVAQTKALAHLKSRLPQGKGTKKSGIVTSYLNKAKGQSGEGSQLSESLSALEDRGAVSKLNFRQVQSKQLLHKNQTNSSGPYYSKKVDSRKGKNATKKPSSIKQVIQNQQLANRGDSSNGRLETRDTFDLNLDANNISQTHRLQTARGASTLGQSMGFQRNPESLQEKKRSLPYPTQHTPDITQEFVNESLPQKEYAFTSNIVVLLLMFNIHEYPKYLRISAAWYCVISDSMDEYTNKLENDFVKTYANSLNFLRSYTSATPVTFCRENGTRLDRIFQCEIAKNSKAVDKTFRIGCNFEYLEKNLEQNTKYIKSQNKKIRYAQEYKFDVIKQGQPRVTWMHFSEDMQPYSQNEIQMCPGDVIEIAVCISNLNGIIDLTTFDWEPEQFLKINSNEKDVLIYNRDVKIMQRMGDRKTKVHCDINRICELEDAVPEWITLGPLLRDQPRCLIDYDQYHNRFKVIQVQFNELDLHFTKILIQATRRGMVEESVFGPEIGVQVKPEGEAVTNEVKKKGMIFDRKVGKYVIQMRVGDYLVVYSSKPIPPDMQPKIVLPTSQYSSTNNYNTQAPNSAHK